MPTDRETVLLVDDNDFVRGYVRQVLLTSGYQVQEAQDGREALRIGEEFEEPIHLLLTDMVMPHLGGRELAERLASRRPGIKVLFMSGFTDDVTIQRNVLTGAVAFLQKPFAPDALSAKVLDDCQSASANLQFGS